MTIRRQTDPTILRRLWNAIRLANQQKVTADLTRITKYMHTYEPYLVPQIEHYITLALNDKLIAPLRKTDGGNGIVAKSYRIPSKEEMPPLDGKDWYCFECHLAGDVMECEGCFRVFHLKCCDGARRNFEFHKRSTNFSLKKVSQPKNLNPDQVTIIDDDEIDNGTTDTADSSSSALEISNVDKSRLGYNERLCLVCNINLIDNSSDMDRTEVNYLLRFVLHRIRAWVPNVLTLTLAVEDTPEWMNETERSWRAEQMFCEHTDTSVLEVKLNTDTYVTFAEFIGDVLTIQHNVAIFHGTDSQEYGATEHMLRDALHDITEMRNCVDCYRHSNEKINPKWFCLPCREPHELVWAKQKGYPYWPAKVMKVSKSGSQYDVRFFGGKYERAVLQKMYIKPIETSKDSLMIKPSTAFNKAFEELRYHQKLLMNPSELEKLVAESNLKRKSLNKLKTPQRTSTVSKPAKKTPAKKTPAKSPRMNPSKQKALARNKTSPRNLTLDTGSIAGSSKRKQSELHDTDCISVDVDSDKRRKTSLEKENDATNTSNVIDISDGEEDDCAKYSYRQNNQPEPFSVEDSFAQVTSSTENFGKLLSPRSESGMQPLDQPYSDSVEKMRRKLECLTNKGEIIKCAMDCMQLEIDRITNDNNDHLKRLFESHNAQISETKKKQWCFNCEQDAIYHCCWNTAYCSQTCQQQHWQAEHKKVCRRKR